MTSPLLTTIFADINETFWFPPKASTFAEETDKLFMQIMWISVVFFVLIVGAMLWFVKEYRRRPGYKGDSSALHSNTLEITWTVIPTIIVIWIFARGVQGYVDMVTPPSGDTVDINVKAQMWAWSFTYPNGAISDELHVPIDRPVRLRMRSQDVLHAFYVPAFRAKSDVVPGRVTTMWFEAIKEGTYDLFCAEYCGDRHSEMIKRAGVTVHTQEGYDAWLAEAAKPPTHPVSHGYWLYKRQGCAGCHSLKEGTKIVGPWFTNSWGNPVETAQGESIDFDGNYVRESILYPQAKARSGYESASKMPSYNGQLTEDELTALTAFLEAMSNPEFVALADDEDGFTKEDAKALGYEEETSEEDGEAPAETPESEGGDESPESEAEATGDEPAEATSEPTGDSETEVEAVDTEADVSDQ